MNLKKTVLNNLLLTIILILGIFISNSQAQDLTSQNSLSRQIQGLINIAEGGVLVDTVNVWGNVGRTGRYVVPRDLNIPKLISYAGGLSAGRDNRQQLEWVNNRISIQINRYNPQNGTVESTFFKSNYEEPLPAELFQYNLQNEDIITVQVERKPNFWDYLGRAAPLIGVITSTVILIDRF